MTVQLADRGGSSIQFKTKSLTPFRLRSNHEDLTALCNQVAASVPPDPPAVTDHRRSGGELASTSPQIGRRTLGQKTGAGAVSGGSTGSLDIRSRLATSRPWGPRTFSATASPAVDPASEYGSCASLDSADHHRTKTAPDAEASSAVESDLTAAAASDVRRRRRAELVRARTAGERTPIADGATPVDAATDRPGHLTSTDSATFRPHSGITSSSLSTPSLHIPDNTSSPIATSTQSFQQPHSKTPWRSTHTGCDFAHNLDHRSRYASDLPLSTTGAPTTVSSSSSTSVSKFFLSAKGIKHDHRLQKNSLHEAETGSRDTGFRKLESEITHRRGVDVTGVDISREQSVIEHQGLDSESRTSDAGLKNDFEMPEIASTTSAVGSASSVAFARPSKTEPDQATKSAPVETSRARPRVTIYSFDTQGRDIQSSAAGCEPPPTKDRFNELLGKALGATSSAGGHHQPQQEAPPDPQRHKSSKIVDQVHKQAPMTKNVVLSSTPELVDSLTAEPESPRQLVVSGRLNNEPGPVSTLPADATDPFQSAQVNLDNYAARKPAGSKHQPSKQYISDSSAIFSVKTTQSILSASTDDVSSHRSQKKSLQEAETKCHDMGFGQPAFPSFDEDKVGGVQRRDVLNANYVQTSNTPDHSKLESAPFDSVAGSQKIDPRHGIDVVEAVKTKQELYVLPHQRLLGLERENNADKVPRINDSSSSRLPRLHTVSTKINSTVNETARLNTTSPAIETDHRMTSKSTEISSNISIGSAKPEVSILSESPAPLNGSKKPEHCSENRLDKTLSTGSRSVEETQIVHVLTVGDDNRSHSSTATAANVSLVHDSSRTVLPQTSELVTPQSETPSVNVGVSRLSGEGLPLSGQTSTAVYFPDDAEMPSPTLSELYVPEITNASVVPDAVMSLVPEQSSPLSVDLRLVDSKPSTAEPRQMHEAEFTSVPPCLKEEAGNISQPERQTAVVQETLENEHAFTDAATEVQRVKPMNVESAFCVSDARRLLAATGSYCRADLTTLAASEAGESCPKTYIDPNSDKVERMEDAALYERINPRIAESLFPSVDARSQLRKTNCLYHTKLLTFHPTKKDAVVQADHVGKSAVNRYLETTTGTIKTLSPESCRWRSVEDVMIRNLGESVKVFPVPKIFTMAPERRQVVSPKTKQKAMPASGTNLLRADVDPAADFQREECVKNLNQETLITDYIQPIVVGPSVKSVDTARFHKSGPTGAFPNSDSDQLSVRRQSDLNSRPDSVAKSTESYAVQDADVRRTNWPQSQGSVIHTGSLDAKQLSEHKLWSERDEVVTGASHAINKPFTASRSNQSTGLSASLPPADKNVSLSSSYAASFSDRAAVSGQCPENFSAPLPPRTEGGSNAAFAVKRDSAAPKARNIIRSREDFLALQSLTNGDSLLDDAGKMATLQEQCSTTRRTSDAANQDVVAELRPSKTVKVAFRDEDGAEELVGDEGEKVGSGLDSVKAEFPRLVSGRSWDAVVRSSSVDDPSSPVCAERRPAEPRRSAAAAYRGAYSGARAETAVGVSAATDSGRASRPILQMAKSVDTEPSVFGAVNIDPQLAAVLRMRKQREEELEREDAELRDEQVGHRYSRVELLFAVYSEYQLSKGAVSIFAIIVSVHVRSLKEVTCHCHFQSLISATLFIVYCNRCPMLCLRLIEQAHVVS